MTEPLRILSLGAGVQSTTVILMAVNGEIPPIDHAIFADTGDEPEQVYTHFEWLRKEVEKNSDTVVHLVQRTDSDGVPVGALSVELKRQIDAGKLGGAQPPLYLHNLRGETGSIRRQCTGGFKIQPIESKIRELAGVQPRQRLPRGEIRVEQLFGISWDETQRMRTPALSWIKYDYPLVDHHMTRNDCLNWMAKHGYPRPPRSSCVYCPYRNLHDWRELKKNPNDWDAAIRFDEMIRDAGEVFGFEGTQLFIHSSGKPLAEVDLDTLEDKGQLVLFANECEGMCGM